jgi:segregation and condensation protein A
MTAEGKRDNPMTSDNANDGVAASQEHDARGSSVVAWDEQRPLHEHDEADALMVDVDGFEGPLDMLLAMARTQKVDLARISVLQLAEQYLAFISEARALRIELAADYLVMAAWLAFLKSRLLLPREATDDEELSGEALAQRLAFRLMRLDAMRKAGGQLMKRNRLGRDVFPRGHHEKVETVKETVYKAELFDLLRAYTEPRRRTAKTRVHVVKRRPAWSIKDARRRLQELVGVGSTAWVQLDSYLVRYLAVREEARSVVASSFGASLEMAREGLVDLRQDDVFEPIFVRRREDSEATWDQRRD